MWNSLHSIVTISSLILVVFLLHYGVDAIDFNYKIHHLMNENERRFYFNVNSSKSEIPEYEVVELKVQQNKANDTRRTDQLGLKLGFRAFERSIHLKLRPNNQLLSPGFEAWRVNDRGEREKVVNQESRQNCLFIHADANSVGAVNNCDNDHFAGIVVFGNHVVEFQPINDRLRNILISNFGYDRNKSTYLVKKFKVEESELEVLNKQRNRRAVILNETRTYLNGVSYEPVLNNGTESRILKKEAKLTVEVGLFFDEAAYKIFAPIFDHNEKKLSEMLLVYMNAVQALYHHSSLGIPIDIAIVHMEIMHKQPKSLPTFNGERDQLLDAFCSYQKRINPPEDSHLNHWDMALYISGLDFYGYDKGFNSGATMGLAAVRGVCSSEYACVIAEFGTTNAFGRPYPSAGFTSVYILAHEMGHNLGMTHDSSGNSCSKEGYIMSPSRGTQGETTWSPCSADVARNLFSWADCLKDRPLATPDEYNAWRYLGYPGQIWSAKRQCELLLTDNDSTTSAFTNLPNICQNLQCRSPHRSGFFFAGPALEGTDCGGNNWCEGGYCVPKKPITPPEKAVIGGWSSWKYEKCNSSCIEHSQGFQERRRLCDNPPPKNTNAGCDGPSYDVIICNDSSICKAQLRISSESYASTKCKEFSRLVTDLDPEGKGLQAPHEATRLWMGCAIFCKRRSTQTFYTPRLELNDFRVNPYFPDGTLCHAEKKLKYYCLQHHCLPEGFQFNRISPFAINEDVPISGNANLKPINFNNSKLIDYLSLDKDGKPILRHITPADVAEFGENENGVDDIDFKIIPNL